MREYRGKREDNGEWVYGYWDWDRSDDGSIKYFIHTGIDGVEFEEFYEVLPETIGQYTGFRDEDCKEIYDKEQLKHAGQILFVYWDAKDGQWKVRDKDKIILEPLWKYAQVSEIVENDN